MNIRLSGRDGQAQHTQRDHPHHDHMACPSGSFITLVNLPPEPQPCSSRPLRRSSSIGTMQLELKVPKVYQTS